VNGTVWERTPDKSTWRAARGSVLLTVTKLSNDMFRADVEGPGIVGRSPEFRTRLAAQAWAESSTGGAA
jgi:hypothetical protein